MCLKSNLVLQRVLLLSNFLKTNVCDSANKDLIDQRGRRCSQVFANSRLILVTTQWADNAFISVLQTKKLRLKKVQQLV